MRLLLSAALGCAASLLLANLIAAEHVARDRWLLSSRWSLNGHDYSWSWSIFLIVTALAFVVSRAAGQATDF